MENWSVWEMRQTTVPDKRMVANLCRMCDNLASQSGVSFSTALGHAGRQAATRLFGHKSTTVKTLLSGHRHKTQSRCGWHNLVLAISDTTLLDYSTHKATQGLGPIGRNPQSYGLLAHSVLAASPEGVPLGVLSLQIWARDPQEYGQSSERHHKDVTQKESHKWLQANQEVEEALADNLAHGRKVLTIADREADLFDYLAAPRHPNMDLLIRAAHPRRVEVADPTHPSGKRRTNLSDALALAPSLGEYEVEIPWKAGGRPSEPGAPKTRRALMTVQLQAVTVLAPTSKGHPVTTPQSVMVVRAEEQTPPEGEEALCWTLLTTLPIATFEEAQKLIFFYTCRWLIERLHYTLKSGLQIERLQMAEKKTLSHAAVIYYIVAWRLLYLTYMARQEPDASATQAFEPLELEVLESKAGKSVETIAKAVHAIARLGGYRASKNQPEPGVKVLWIGLRRLDAMVEGWTLALKKRKRAPITKYESR